MFQGSSSEMGTFRGTEGRVGGCSRGFDSKQLAGIGAGMRSESAAGCFGGQVLQEPGLAAARAASLPGHIFLYCSI